MRILIYGNTYLSELCTRQLLRDGFSLVGYVPSFNPTFGGKMPIKEVDESIEHDIKLSIQYDKKIVDVKNAYNLHTGLLPEYGGCSILYHTVKNGEKEQGLTFHKMTEKFDEGGVISKMTYAVLPTDNVSDLYIRMLSIAPRFLSNALTLIKVQRESQKPRLFKKNDIPKEISLKDTQEIKNRISSKCCKIISICMKNDGDVRTNVSYPAHNQNSPTSLDMLKMVQDLYELECKQDAGVPLDIYFINNDVGFKEGNDWLNSIQKTPTKNGTIYVIHRGNIGGSFGAYHDAHSLLKDKYKWFLFTEEDLFIFGQDYYRKAIERFEELDLGFLAFIGIETKRNPTHAHGGVGLTTREILNDIVRVQGELPHSKESFDKQKVIRWGEIPLTNTIHRLGYRMERMGEIEDWNEKNYILPYYNVIH